MNNVSREVPEEASFTLKPQFPKGPNLAKPRRQNDTGEGVQGFISEAERALARSTSPRSSQREGLRAEHGRARCRGQTSQQQRFPSAASRAQ